MVSGSFFGICSPGFQNFLLITFSVTVFTKLVNDLSYKFGGTYAFKPWQEIYWKFKKSTKRKGPEKWNLFCKDYWCNSPLIWKHIKHCNLNLPSKVPMTLYWASLRLSYESHIVNKTTGWSLTIRFVDSPAFIMAFYLDFW